MKKVKISDYHYLTKDGKVISLYSGKEKYLSLYENNEGYPLVTIVGKEYKVHRLIAKHFVENPKPEEYDQVNHIDGVKNNNHYTNLEWCNNSMNQQHAWDTGLQIKIEAENRVLTQEQADTIRRRYLEENLSQRKLASEYSVAKTTIADILSGKYYNLDGKHKNISREKDKRQFTYEVAEEIRGKYATGEYSYYKLGKEYNVDHKTIKKIVDRISYKSP